LFISSAKPAKDYLIVYTGTIAVYSQIHTKHTITLNVEIVNVKLMVHIVTTGL